MASILGGVSRRGALGSCAIALATSALLAGGAAAGGGKATIPTTPADFFQPGTQPDPVGLDPFFHSFNCSACHGYFLPDDDHEPYDSWAATLMAQSARDPVWHAAVAIANQDAAGSGETCIRCHAPVGWLAGRSTGGEIADLAEADFDGVTCHVCHRMVDPDPSATGGPPEDAGILEELEMAGLLYPPGQVGNGRSVIDPTDSRRGPFDDVPANMHFPADIAHSPFHRRSELCATCHDVSTPTFTRQPDGSYALNDVDQPHPTQNPHDMFPEQRTYSEWLNSTFAQGGVHFADGRFGGNHPTGVMESCQDCHMPDTFTGGCFAFEEPPFFARPDMPKHSFAGANTWVLGAVLAEYGQFETGLSAKLVQAAQDRTIQMLRNASDMALAQKGGTLNVRVTNYSGHKLFTGYPEGRRMWLNVAFLDDDDQVIAEHGRYDWNEALLVGKADTKVYEVVHGVDQAMSEVSGLPPGHTFHLVFNNTIYSDNRIPPIGFTNAAYQAIGAAPVGYAYADGQHWDDTTFAIPACAARAVVTLYYQTTTREYIEFLRDAGPQGPGSAGQIAYDAWVGQGRSAPVDMDSMQIELAPVQKPDTNGDGQVNITDLINVILSWGVCKSVSCPADTNCDGFIDVGDLIAVIVNWG
jgi:hypothetical protein